MLSSDDPKFSADMVSALNLAANEAHYAGSVVILNRYFNNVSILHVTDDVPNRPNTSLYLADGWVIALCGGVRQDSMYPLVIDGWSDLAKVTLANGFNHYAYQIAQEQLEPIKFPQLASKPRWLLVGTSLGSMVCHAFNYLNRVRGQRDADNIITIGSPRALAAGFNGTYGDGDHARYMNIGDPVCSFPPRFSEAPLLVTAASGLQGPWDRLLYLTISGEANAPAPISLWPRFHHGPGGIALTSDGDVWREDHPVPNALLGTIAPGVLAAYQGSEQFAGHATLVYESNLIRRYKLGEGRLALGTSGGEWGLEAGFDVDPSFILPVDIGGNFLPTFEGGFFPMPASPIKTDTMPGPNGKRLGILVLNGEIIAVYDSRSRAQTASRYLRRFLSRLPAANSVSLSGFMAGLGNYLGAASRGRGVTKKSVVVAS